MSKRNLIAAMYPRTRRNGSVAAARHLALWTLLVAISACDAPPRSEEPRPPKAPAKESAKAPSKQQVVELSEQCAKMSREQFRRAWKDGTDNTADGKATAQFANHYNVKLNTCFYLLTVASPDTLRKMLFDVNGGELYGEYLGPTTGRSKTCRVENLYCASGGEWQVLVTPYLED